MNAQPRSPRERINEHRFYSGMSLLLLLFVLAGFGRTFFLQPWVPEAAALAPKESFFFYVHGVVFSLWILLALLQPLLIMNRQIDWHRRLGRGGVALAAAVLVVGVLASLIAAKRPGGFIGVPVPPLQFLAVPMADLALFMLFFSLALAWRRTAQYHKRLMLLATIGLMDAAIVRLPLGDMTTPLIGPWFTLTDIGVDLLLLPMIAWDVATRGRVHPVTLLGGLTVIASQPLRAIVSEADAWLRFAAWAVGLMPP